MEATHRPHMEPALMSDAKVLLPDVVDLRATRTPDAIYAEYPVSPLTYDEGYRQVTYKVFANAVNGAAQWLIDKFGSSEDFETLAYIGPNDVRYTTFILGAVKAGYKLYLPSPRNSVTAQLDLFAKLKCKILLCSTPRPPAVRDLDHVDGPMVVEVPEVSFFLDEQHPTVQFDRLIEVDYLSEPLFVVHTSGSTGIPKPLIYTHAMAAMNRRMMSLDPPSGYESQDKMYQGNRVFITFPPFHGAYLVTHLFNAITFKTIMIAPISGSLPSGKSLVEGLKKAPADVAIIVPSIVQDLAQDPELLKYCSRNLSTILYCGGDLPLEIGNTVASKIRLLNQYGASELGLTSQILPKTGRDPMDWKYAQFHPDLGLELRQSAGDTYELFVDRRAGRADVQPTFQLFPDIQEYASRDLFVRHPSKDKPNLWSWKARADDIIVFLNGEKTNPISAEQYLMTHNTDVSADLVVGAQRFQAALLVEPKDQTRPMSVTERAKFIERIWPSVEATNKDAPSHARIMKSHISFTEPDKPMMRAGKGTVQRSGTLRLYASEIDELYKSAELMTPERTGEAEPSLVFLRPDDMLEYIKESILRVMGWSRLEDSEDFFDRGMDSLLALTLVRDLRRSLGIQSIASSTIYANPTLERLQDIIWSIREQDAAAMLSLERKRIQERSSLIKSYKKKLDEVLMPRVKAELNPGRHVVLLTGSTGNLGAYLLNVLHQDPDVGWIACLNRSGNAMETQLSKNRLLGLEYPSDEKILFLTADYRQRNFGLSEDVYQRLSTEVTLVIHNAWTVDFNLALKSFGPQLDTLVNLLAFTNQCKHTARFLYISSISSVMSSRPEKGLIPETVINADSIAGANGYADSKYIAEQIINHATPKFSSECPPAFARVGQVAGAVQHQGLWNKKEWFPSLILSSNLISALPESLGPQFDQVDWVPIDLLARILVELATTKLDNSNSSSARLNANADTAVDEQRRALVYHPQNPNPTPWSTLRDAAKDHLNFRNTSGEKPIDILPMKTWISKVRQMAEHMTSNDSDTNTNTNTNANININNKDKHQNDENTFAHMLTVNPAAKLLDFYSTLAAPTTITTTATISEATTDRPLAVKFESEKTARLSKTMRNLEPLREEDMRKWIDEWWMDRVKDGDKRHS